MIGAPLGRAGGKPQRNCTSSTLRSCRRKTGEASVGQMSSRGSRFGAAIGNTTGARIADLAERLQIGAVGHVIAEVIAHGRVL
jgi:hypothetical protein